MVTENACEGTDTVYTTVDYTLSDNVERMVMGLGGLLDSGNTLANAITGSTCDETINGGDGFDVLRGGTGADTFRFREGENDNFNAFQGALRQVDDFNRGADDKIDLSGNGGTFAIVGSHTLGTGCELTLRYIAGANVTLAQVYLDGDSTADLTLRIWNDGFAGPLQASDFLLG